LSVRHLRLLIALLAAADEHWPGFRGPRGGRTSSGPILVRAAGMLVASGAR
jgi:hypothetical protein